MTNVSKHIGATAGHACRWNTTDWHKVNRMVKRLQMRIAKAVREGKWHKVKALQWLLTRSFFARLLAVKRVTSNNGAKTPGIDKITWRTQTQKLNGALSLRRNGYKAQPLKRKDIPKANGKTRPLGIPTIRDRAMQALYLLALEPIAETTADPNSYGFRPYRSCRDAIGQCFCALSQKHSARWILDADIQACFDWIDHDWLLKNIPLDKYMLRQWLTCGVVKERKLFATNKGTPQGGIISPTLANMTLDGLEKRIKEMTPARSKVNVIRYADDFIVTAASRELIEDTIIPVIENFLNPRGLRLSPEKTRITRIESGVDFLGQNLRKYDNKLIIKPARRNVKTFLEKSRRILNLHNGNSAGALIKALNPRVRGWANYHRCIPASKTFAYVETVLYHSLWRWLRRQHGGKSRRWIAQRYWNQNSTRRRPWIFTAKDATAGGKSAQICLIRPRDIKLMRYIKVKGIANPYDPMYWNYFLMRTKSQNGRIIDNRTAGLKG